MWELYTKRLPFFQVLIWGVCVCVYFLVHEWKFTLILFGVMQLGAIYGAWFGYRIKRKIEAQAIKLPLQGKKL